MTNNSGMNLYHCRISISPNNHLTVGSSYMLYEGFLVRWQATKINVFYVVDYAIVKYTFMKASKPASTSFATSHVSQVAQAQAAISGLSTLS